MLKRLRLVVLLAGSLFAIWLWTEKYISQDSSLTPKAFDSSTAETALSGADADRAAKRPEPSGDASDEDVKAESSGLDLALKFINLSQGEGGAELWRLKAEWANMQKTDGRIFVDKPKLIYFMKDDGKEMHVRSDTGNIDQKEQILRFITNVRIDQDNRTMYGDLLIYNGTAKTMAFPHGGNFTGTGMAGSAPVVIWHINNRTVEARDGVNVFFEADGSKPE